MIDFVNYYDTSLIHLSRFLFPYEIENDAFVKFIFSSYYSSSMLV